MMALSTSPSLNEGTLQKIREYVFVKLDEKYLVKIFDKIKEMDPDAQMARFHPKVGPHFSIIRHDEWRETSLQNIPEIGSRYLFRPTRLDTVYTSDKKLWVLIVEPSPELLELRERYAIGSLPHGHEFHITVAQSNFK
jgi:hypothetical protein